jgi:hypothetical protein
MKKRIVLLFILILNFFYLRPQEESTKCAENKEFERIFETDSQTSGKVKNRRITDSGDRNIINNDTVVRIRLESNDCTFADHADYGIFVPATSSPLQGVLVLQHGCTMEQFGITKPYDLQYRAFARKWKIAIVETALHGDCHIWKEPKSGSSLALLKVLKETALQTGHSELEDVPWLLWGHSAGGYWSLAMLRDYPERILAIVCYSAAGDPQWEYSATAAKVPLLLRHAGVNDGTPEIRCPETAINTFNKLRAMDAPVSIAYNEGQNHNFSYLRYMMIPFFEIALKQRLLINESTDLQDIDRNATWLGDTLSLEIFKESDYSGDKNGMCLFPDELTARNWQEFVSTGTVTDKTPPPAPFNVNVEVEGNVLVVSWEAEADIESGILYFNVYKDNKLIGRLPERGAYQTFDTNGDNTIPVNVPVMKYIIQETTKEKTKISVQAVNHFNLQSAKTEVFYKYNQK